MLIDELFKVTYRKGEIYHVKNYKRDRSGSGWIGG